MPTVLVIDDNEAVFEALEILFSLEGMETRWAETPAQGLARLATQDFDLVIQDMNFSADTTSGEEGVALFRRIRELHPAMPIILLTAWTHLETAIDLVREGAADYVGKPWDDQKLLATVRNLAQLGQLSRERDEQVTERRNRHQRLAADIDLGPLVYESDAMHEVVALAARIARSELPVLVTGSNGTGKEMLADFIHRNSAVRNGPCIKVNAGALPADLMEAELFGAEAGAYTGATRSREGRFEAADGGTLFLDEIGNLPPEGQVKLLRVLQTGEFERLGSSKTRKVSVRLVSATNADLQELINAGQFREDLYYRLNVIELRLPDLVERRDDIIAIARALLPEGSRLTPDAEAALRAHDWPGNVRELKNVLQRASLLASTPNIDVSDLQLPVSRSAPPRKLAADDILAALEQADGVVATAARALGLSRQALYRRMERFGIDVDELRGDADGSTD